MPFESALCRRFLRWNAVSPLVLFAFALLFLFAQPAYAQDQGGLAVLDPSDGPVYVPGRLIVGVTGGESTMQAAGALQAFDAQVIQPTDSCVATDLAAAGDGEPGPTVVQVWQVAPGAEETAMEILRQQPGIAFVERDIYMYAAQEGVDPDGQSGVTEEEQIFETAYSINDPLYAPYQWGPQRANFPRAWQLIPNGAALTTIRVAVIDSGVDFSHPDLAMRLLNGKNYLDPNSLPLDDNGHGTHVAGIIAAVTNNGLGIAGSAPRVLIDPRKVLSASGSGPISNLRPAICDAARQGARIINMSLQIPAAALPVGSTTYNQIKEAIDFAEARGVLMIAAGGNSRTAPQVFYPALFDEVMAVAASDVNNARAGYSAVGTKVEIIAPGGETLNPVFSTWPSDAIVRNECTRTGAPIIQSGTAWYCGEIGTSMAAPYVVGGAALAWSINPNLSAARVRTLLKETATDLGLPATQQGAGLLNAEALVRRLLPSSLLATPDGAGKNVPLGSKPFTTTIVLSNPSLDPLAVTGITIGGAPWLSISNSASPTVTGSIRHGQPLVLSAVISPTHLPEGTYIAKVQLNATRTDGTTIAKTLTLFAGVGVVRPPVYLPFVVQGVAPQQQMNVAPGFTWEAAVAPTVLSVGAAGSAAVTLPFNFPLSGTGGSGSVSYGSARVYADGFVTFPSGDFPTVENPGINRCLPLTDFDEVQGVFGWWADLDASVPGAEVSVFRPAGTPSRFVIQYKDVASVGVSPAYKVSFQIVLYASGDVQINYLQAPPAWAPTLTDLRPRVTVGMQSQNGLFRNQIACLTGSERLGTVPLSMHSVRLAPADLY